MSVDFCSISVTFCPNIIFGLNHDTLAQYQEYQSIFTWFLLTTSCGGLILDPIQQRFGTLVVRLIMGSMSTAGILVLIFYEENPYLIWGGWHRVPDQADLDSQSRSISRK